MPKQQFFMRLIPPRPVFPWVPGSLTDAELALMKEHAVYMAKAFEEGKILGYGPVFDPAGAFGVALLEVEDLAEAESLMRNDPSIAGGMNTYSIAPMKIAGAQGPRGAA